MSQRGAKRQLTMDPRDPASPATPVCSPLRQWEVSTNGTPYSPLSPRRSGGGDRVPTNTDDAYSPITPRLYQDNRNVIGNWGNPNNVHDLAYRIGLYRSATNPEERWELAQYLMNCSEADAIGFSIRTLPRYFMDKVLNFDPMVLHSPTADRTQMIKGFISVVNTRFLAFAADLQLERVGFPVWKDGHTDVDHAGTPAQLVNVQVTATGFATGYDLLDFYYVEPNYAMLHTLLEERHNKNVSCRELCDMQDLVTAKADNYGRAQSAIFVYYEQEKIYNHGGWGNTVTGVWESGYYRTTTQ